ncbi:MFS transporter [Hymenobacter sp. PAMC 26628]|uniref:MFS transporter n=1 Tax=Hymenobacter sp. PAMC 26628 TaxID=1484118 RepID=UPI0007700DA5|nr:MFS transporter [Hymenobacter sp. PAMC 26628]AMJ65525.1 MFS transporter [Hymenobacter sp. PAMC 26628]
MSPTESPILTSERPPSGLFSAIVVVAALGYFVDIYDLVLFSIIRVKSLNGIGITDAAAVTDQGLHLLSMQMWGMLLGGILWGVLGDKRGRLSVLFGSILLYSLANIANGFVQNVDQYAWLRLIAGVGLAGELGAGITLVSESLPKEKRGYGTMIVASVGVSGAMVAYLVGQEFGWRNAYFIGGALGLGLLALRAGVFESGMFETTKKTDVARGNLLSLFSNGPRFYKYLRCLLLGTPFWFLVGILITLAPEFGKRFGLRGPVTGGLSIFWCYFGLTLGDFTSGGLSQLFRSRNRTLQVFILATAAMVGVYLFGLHGASTAAFYAVCFFVGYAGGFWALFVTVAAEQFGTNLRATAATTIPNFARGATVFIVPLFQWLKAVPALGMVGSAGLIGAVLLALAFFSAHTLPETYAKDLDYVEE